MHSGDADMGSCRALNQRRIRANEVRHDLVAHAASIVRDMHAARPGARGGALTSSLTALAAATLLLVAATSDAASVLRRGAFAEPESLEPRQSGVSSEQTILRDLFEGLTTHDASGRIVPGAAQSWTLSSDGLQYTFKLRAGLRWSDGSPLTASDFVFGWRRSLTPATTATRATRLYVIRNAAQIHAGRAEPQTLGARALDPRTLQIELQRPTPWLPALLAGEEGVPLPQRVVAQHGNNWTRAGTQISNGAFFLAERRPRGNVRLAKNPYFHDAERVRLDEIVYIPSDDTSALINRFRAAELEINGWPGFAAQRQVALQRELGSAVHVTPLLSVRYLRFNLRRAPFDDIRVRRALSLAIDRELLVRRVVQGGERASVRAVPLGLDPDVASASNELLAGTQAERLSTARALLAGSQFSSRHPGPIRLRLPAGNGEDICLAVAAMWTAAGARTVLEQSEIKSLIADLRRGDFDVALTGAQDTPAVEVYLERLRDGSSYNTGGFSSPAFEALLDSAQQMTDPLARARELSRAELTLNQQHPIAPLLQEVARNLVSVRVIGWLDNAEDIHLSRYLALK